MAVGVEKRDFLESFEEVIQTKCKKGDAFQTTVLIIKKTKESKVIDEHPIEIAECGVQPKVPKEFITPALFPTVVKKNPKLEIVMKFIEKKNPKLVGITPQNCIVENHGTPKKPSLQVTVMFENKENPKEPERVVCIQNEEEEPILVEDTIVVGGIKPTTITVDTSP